MIGDLLVPHDLTEFADRGLDAVDDLHLQVERRHVVHVLPRIDLTYPGVVWSRDEDEERRRHALEALRTRLVGTRRWGQASLHVVVGDPGARVVELAREISAGLIVVPSHGRTGIKRLMLGSVAEHVARFAPCPVLVLPPSVAAHALAQAPTPSPIGRADETPREQVDALGVEICERVAQTPGYLTAVRVGLPEGFDAPWWEEALEKRLSQAGIDYVDLTFSTVPARWPVLLDTRFQEP